MLTFEQNLQFRAAIPSREKWSGIHAACRAEFVCFWPWIHAKKTSFRYVFRRFFWGMQSFTLCCNFSCKYTVRKIGKCVHLGIEVKSTSIKLRLVTSSCLNAWCTLVINWDSNKWRVRLRFKLNSAEAMMNFYMYQPKRVCYPVILLQNHAKSRWLFIDWKLRFITLALTSTYCIQTVPTSYRKASQMKFS